MLILKRFIENTLYSARWSLVPIYLGLGLILLALPFKFFQKILCLFTVILAITEKDLVLVFAALDAAGFAMLGGLVMSVVFSSYEISISRLDTDPERKPNCLGKVSAPISRSKITTSIVTSHYHDFSRLPCCVPL
uniref:TIGR00645 family protein n=1 Tax=Candidatus Kentrum sp. LFY TaxID=2126342 RepID=A0A450V391_9GAMM|nr:MAG: TIGR00645 family protein [Candidatus Kentron sp. LFY]VFJ99282.1 MAG: TIGR00645 family protein [Candidatus Kentron sp. LFY]